MDPALQLVIEMTEMSWNRFKDDLKDLTAEEIDWRPLPQANNINLIIRHLRIEAEWHLASLERGERMPLLDITPELQRSIDAVPLDFERNVKELDALFNGFIAALRRTTLDGLEKQTALAYSQARRKPPPHLLGFHQLLHFAGHAGQISSIRNLYRRTRGEPSRFVPVNPSFPT